LVYWNISISKRLGIWFNNSGSFNFAQNELYQKALKALFKLKSDFLVHNPEVKTSIHVVDHTIKPILLYGCARHQSEQNAESLSNFSCIPSADLDKIKKDFYVSL
jgi:hypothetical protein